MIIHWKKCTIPYINLSIAVFSMSEFHFLIKIISFKIIRDVQLED